MKVAKEACKRSQVNGVSRMQQPKLWQYTSWPSLEKLGISKKKWEVQKDHRILMFICLFVFSQKKRGLEHP